MKPKKSASRLTDLDNNKTGRENNFKTTFKDQIEPSKRMRPGQIETARRICARPTILPAELEPKDEEQSKKHIQTCSGCHKLIKKDKYLLRVCDEFWHENCLRCDKCNRRLGELGPSLYRKSNMYLCQRDYLDMFGETGVCSVCDKIIRASELVMRAKQYVYHLECFACNSCNERFCVGDSFYLSQDRVICHECQLYKINLSGSLALTETDSTGEQPGVIYQHRVLIQTGLYGQLALDTGSVVACSTWNEQQLSLTSEKQLLSLEVREKDDITQPPDSIIVSEGENLDVPELQALEEKDTDLGTH